MSWAAVIPSTTAVTVLGYQTTRIAHRDKGLPGIMRRTEYILMNPLVAGCPVIELYTSPNTKTAGSAKRSKAPILTAVLDSISC